MAKVGQGCAGSDSNLTVRATLLCRLMACKSVLEEDLLADLPVKAYTQQFADNPHVKKIMAERKANSEIMMALRSGKK